MSFGQLDRNLTNQHRSEWGDEETHRFTELFTMNLIVFLLNVYCCMVLNLIACEWLCGCKCNDLHEYNVFIRFSHFCLMANIQNCWPFYQLRSNMCVSVCMYVCSSNCTYRLNTLNKSLQKCIVSGCIRCWAARRLQPFYLYIHFLFPSADHFHSYK